MTYSTMYIDNIKLETAFFMFLRTLLILRTDFRYLFFKSSDTLFLMLQLRVSNMNLKILYINHYDINLKKLQFVLETFRNFV